MKYCFSILVVLLSVSQSALSNADQSGKTIDSLYQSMDEIVKNSQKSQQIINELSDQEREDFLAFKDQLKINEGLSIYNAQLTEQVNFQQSEIEQLNQSIDDVTLVERQIMPLMIKMIANLDSFIEGDLPFLIEERKQRVLFLKDAITRSDVSVSEKYRQVLDAYLVEIDYGRKIETYQDVQNLSGVDIEVNMLRLGRTALIYQTIDQQNTAVWDSTSNQWLTVDRKYNTPVRNAIRIANKQATANLTTLPLITTELN